jgi:release factor glutamine methyltransferase
MTGLPADTARSQESMFAPAATIYAALRHAGQHLPALEARMLLEEALGVNHAYLAAHPERALTAEEARRIRALIERRAEGEPIAYIVGRREFYGLEFEVNASVLIPRPETELLVDLALERIPENALWRVLDLGTGSGNIAITLGMYRPAAQVVAIENSEQALRLAQENAARVAMTAALPRFDASTVASTAGAWDLPQAFGTGGVRFVYSDWYRALVGKEFDLIVSNPPYVAEGDPHLDQGDVRFEPQAALIAGPDGLDCTREIIAGASHCLVENGWLLFEHGCDQAEPCRGLLESAGFRDIFCAHDLAGLPRVSGGRLAPGFAGARGLTDGRTTG